MTVSNLTFAELERQSYINDDAKLNAFVARAYELEGDFAALERAHEALGQENADLKQQIAETLNILDEVIESLKE